jgi:hypothetical protein
MPDLEIHRIADGSHVGTWKSIVIELVQSEQTVDGIRVTDRCLRAAIASNPSNSVGLIIITAAGAKAPTAEVREAIAKSSRKNTNGQVLAGACLVIEGSGFQASVMRSALAAFSVMGQSGVVDKVFATTDEAVEWLVKRPGWPESTTGPALKAAIAEFRASVAKQSPNPR